MTKLETAIRQVSDLREFYVRLQADKKTNNKKPGTRRRGRPAKPGAER